MKKKIDPELKLVSEYLTIAESEQFVIPEYQRSYSWTIAECDKLLQDVNAFINTLGSDVIIQTSGDGDPYFLGTVIADCSNPAELTLIDGQQRTITFILLLKALLLRMQELLSAMCRDDESEGLYEALKEKRNRIIDILYKTNSDSRLAVLRDWEKIKGTTILTSRSINELPQFKEELQTILDAADYATAEQRCYKFPRKRKDNRYTNFFRNFKFLYERIGKYKEVETNIFARTILDKCQVIEIRSWNTEQAITMFNSLNATGMPLTDADIISAQLYSNAGEEKTSFMEQWEEMTQLAALLSDKNLADVDSLLQQYMYILRAQSKEYIKEGQKPNVTTPGVRRYYTLENKEVLKDPMAFSNRMKELALQWNRIKDFSLVKLLLKFNENIKLYMMSYLSRYEVDAISEGEITPILECLIRLFAVLELVDVGYSSSRFKTFLFEEAVELVDRSVPEEQIIQNFTNHIRRTWTREELLSAVEDYEKNVLVFLNEYLYARAKECVLSIGDSVNVEHIMPASGRNIRTIQEDAGIATWEEFKIVVNKLGNKILLEEDINKAIGRDWFRTKKQKSVKDKKGYKDSHYPIAQALTNYPSDTWQEKDIKATTKKAAERIVDFLWGKESLHEGRNFS